LTVAAIISLFLAPLLGLIVSKILNLSFPLAVGLIIISTVPPTISSGIVITEVSHGNTTLALFLTITLNLLGIFSMPFVLDICLHAAGPIDIDQTALLLKMLIFVLLPFIVGKGIRRISQRQEVSPLWSYLNSGGIILIIYASASTSTAAFTKLSITDYFLILAGVAIVHTLLLAINYQAGKTLKLSTADNKALLFVCSQKTMALSLAVLASITIDTGSAIVVCLAFHFFQLIVDSFLAARLQNVYPSTALH
jgi:sodium/bile acid cotransporter 7